MTQTYKMTDKRGNYRLYTEHKILFMKIQQSNHVDK